MPMVKGLPPIGERPVPDRLKLLPTDDDLARDPVAALASLPTDRDLPTAEGLPMESPWHRNAMMLLIDSLTYHWRERNDFFVGGNMFVYFSPEYVFHKDFRGPDFFVTFNVPRHKERKSWVAWEEDGRLPDVIIELLSPSTAHYDRVVKRDLYLNVMNVDEYFIYDPETRSFEGWRGQIRSRNGVAIKPDKRGRIRSEYLKLTLGTWEGEYLDMPGVWPRFYDDSLAVVPTFAEASAGEVLRLRSKLTETEAELARLRAELAALKKPKPSK